MSTAQPIQQAPVTLDMSTAQPIGQQYDDLDQQAPQPDLRPQRINQRTGQPTTLEDPEGIDTIPEDPDLMEHSIEGAAAGATAAGLGTIGLAPEAIQTLGDAMLGRASQAIPTITKAVQQATEWVGQSKKNKAIAFGGIWLLNRALAAAGLPNAATVVDKMEVPFLLLFGGAGEAAEASEAAAEAEEAATAGEEATAAEAPTAETAPATEATPEQAAEDFVNRQGVKGTYNAQPDAAGEKLIDPETGEEVSAEEEVPLPKEQRQAAVDKYYADHPEKRPQPQIAKYGPNKGQPRTYKVFDPKTRTFITHTYMTVPKSR